MTSKCLIVLTACSAPLVLSMVGPTAWGAARVELPEEWREELGQVLGEELGPKVDLRPKLKKGQEIRFTLTMNTSGKQTLPGESEAIENKSDQEIGLLLRVKEVSPESGSTLDVVYETYKVRMSTPLGEIDFDSSKPGKGSGASKQQSDPDAIDLGETIFRPIIGLTLSLTMDKDGNITRVSGGEGLGGVAGELTGQFTGADVIKNMFGPIFTLRKGAGEAEVGESWTNEDVIDAPMGQMKIVTTNTLKSHTGGRATIDIKGGVSLVPSGSSGLTPPAIKESSLSGKAVWDTEAGMLSELETRQKLSMEQEQDGQKVGSTQDLRMKVVRRAGR